MEGVNGGGGHGAMPDLFAKIGPLPAWAWGAIAVGAYLFWSHNQASSTVPVADDGSVDTTDTQSVPDVSTSNDYGYATPVDPSSAGYDYSTVNSGGYTGTVTGTAYTSNQAWGVKAISTLIASGIPASTATSGITHYLAGSNLTADEANAVNIAITLLGPPPLPMPVTVGTPVVTQPDPSPTPDPAPVPVVSPTPSPVTSGGTTTVAKTTPKVTMTGPTTGKVGQHLTYVVTVTGAHGTPTGECFIAPGVEGNTIRGQLVNGKATMVYTPTKKEHTEFTGAYEGDDKYNFAQSGYHTLDVT